MSNKGSRLGRPNRIRSPYTFKHMYEDYIKDLSEDSPYFVSYSEYVGICSDYYKARMVDILERGATFKLPYRMGEVAVTKKRLIKFEKQYLPIDWATTREVGKVIYHMNDHTDNYKYRFRWRKKMSRTTPNIGEYRLVFTRANKRKLAECIKVGGYDYIEHTKG